METSRNFVSLKSGNPERIPIQTITMKIFLLDKVIKRTCKSFHI